MNLSAQNDDARFLELLERWQQGDFTRADEQELLGLTGTDDFRREAMEGFMTVPEHDHAASLESLRHRLKARSGREKDRVVPMPQLLAIAAGLALVIGVVVFFPYSNPERSAAPVAQTSPALDSAIVYEELPAENEHRSDALPGQRRQPNREQENDATVANSAAAEQQLALKTEEGHDLAVQAEETYRQEDKSFRSLPPAPVDGSEKAKEDAQKALPQSQSDVVRTPSNTYPNAVQSRPGDARAKKSQPPAKDQLQNQNAVSAGQPVGGWDAFQEYLRRNARLTDAARNNNISGSVRLQFEVNVDGKPISIKVLRPLGYGCDEEAVRLLETWKWTESDLPVTVDIPFVR